MEGPISFWGYKEQESNIILPEHDDDDDDDDLLKNILANMKTCISSMYIQQTELMATTNSLQHQCLSLPALSIHWSTNSKATNLYPAKITTTILHTFNPLLNQHVFKTVCNFVPVQGEGGKRGGKKKNLQELFFLYPFSVHVVTFNFITNLMHLFN